MSEVGGRFDRVSGFSPLVCMWQVALAETVKRRKLLKMRPEAAETTSPRQLSVTSNDEVILLSATYTIVNARPPRIAMYVHFKHIRQVSP